MSDAYRKTVAFACEYQIKIAFRQLDSRPLHHFLAFSALEVSPIRIMKHKKLDHTGLDISRICLGCTTYGAPDRGTHPWTLDEEKSRPLIRRALELGINFFDTANVYSDGTSEALLGRAIRDFSRRDEVACVTR